MLSDVLGLLGIYVDKNRAQLKDAKVNIGALHDDIAEIKHELSEHVAALRACQWHRRPEWIQIGQ